MINSMQTRRNGIQLGIRVLSVLGMATLAPEIYAQANTAGDVLFGATQPIDKSLQRTTARLIDVRETKSKVQLAFVLDGTESMGQDLASLQKNLANVVANLKSDPSRAIESVSVALVVFRDTAAERGAVEIPLATFTEDMSEVKDALSQVILQTGAPYFQERVDAGLNAALTGLDWAPADEEKTERWILCCGDAPPYPEMSPYRDFSNEQLCREANKRKIRFCFVHCSSGFARSENAVPILTGVSKDSRPELEAFASELVKRTEGAQVDTARSQSVDFWLHHQVTFAKAITKPEVDELRKSRKILPSVRIAVLPHAPLADMNFEPTSESVLVARQLAESLQRVDGFDVRIGQPVEREFAQIQKDSTSTTDDDAVSSLISKLARKLDVDYVIWGVRSATADSIQMESKLFRSADGTIVAASSEETQKGNAAGERDLPPLVLKRLCSDTSSRLREQSSKERDVEVFSQFDDPSRQGNEPLPPLAQDIRAMRHLLAGIEYLENSLAYSKDDEDDRAVEALKQAVKSLQASLQFEEANPVTLFMLSNCFFNLSRVDKDRNVALDEYMAKRLDYLKQAHERRNVLREDHPARLEVEVSYQIFVQRDYNAAVKLLQQLVDRRDVASRRFRLRAHWMLAGIYAGDWGAASYAPQLLNPDHARAHVAIVMSDWPESSAAKFFNAHLDEQSIPTGQETLLVQGP